MIAEARDWTPLETGGILMGYWSLTGSEVVITHTIGAGPAAIHRRSELRTRLDISAEANRTDLR